jgi:UDP-N-acetylglucosamine acyltransferase
MKAHPTAVIHPQARLAASVTVGPFAIIGDGVEIGDDSEVISHAVLGGNTRLGRGNRIFPFATIGLEPQDLKYGGEPTRVQIGDGNTIREGVTVHRGTAGGGGLTKIGNHNLLMAYVHVAHDCLVGNHVIMANAATLAGHVEIGDHATIGAYCGVHQFCRVGAYSFVGGYTVVTQDVLPYSKSAAPRSVQVLGANRIGLERRGFSREEMDELDQALRLLVRSKLNTTQALEAIKARGFASGHVRALVEFVRSSQRGVLRGSGTRRLATANDR